ncbi:MAG: TetR family transcriptional regulator [Acidimicrobiales bacterium]|nr:TetR family transcriptional regulator [Acidimicrobiales bacterium]
MSTGYVERGRTQQKQRTREALIAAARRLVAEGSTPTVEEAAAAALISRTTAYRYFASQAALLVAAHPEIDTRSLLPADASDDPAERLDAVLDAITEIIADTEPQQRTVLRLSLDPDPHIRAELPLRQGRAIGWITEALEPLRDQFGDEDLLTLVHAIRSAVGIEALVWLMDVAGHSKEEAVAIQRWSGRAMLAAACDPSGPRLPAPAPPPVG